MRVRAEERGAVLAIVAISLICLLGMLVLTFDLGRGVALKRNMVNGADAGALAAARECGLAKGPDSALAAAQQLVADNNSAAQVTGIEFDSEPQCRGVASDGERQVTVTVSVRQEYFFAQIFGFTEGTVRATATAEYTTGVAYPAPLKIDELRIDDQCSDLDQDKIFDCYFTYEKDKSGAQWGWLDLPEGWPIKGQDANPWKNCDSQKGGSNDLKDYIGTMGGTGTPAKSFKSDLWDPTGAGNPPTWVCAASGHKSSSVEAINAWVSNVKTMMDKGELKDEPVVMFPIVACNSATTPLDPKCREWKRTPGLAYPVVDLNGFWVKEAWDGQQARRQPNCKFTRKSADVFCIHLQTSESIEKTSGGEPKIWLVD